MNHRLPNGAFSYFQNHAARADATAWGVMALSTHIPSAAFCEQGQKYLKTQQAPDGHISVSPQYPSGSWPTPLAIFGWHQSSLYQSAQDRAVQFLLEFSGYHWDKLDPKAIGHDTSLKGWPWVANTHSWVIPTGLAMTALQLVGQGMHARVQTAKSMILDRQLPHGGWNYGNTFVFGKELHPLPECTGVALQALSYFEEERTVERSLDYLLKTLPSIHTPISLGWAILGLGAWGFKPSNSEELILASLDLQKRYGPYPLCSLALLICAAKAPQGILSLFAETHGPSIIFQTTKTKGA